MSTGALLHYDRLHAADFVRLLAVVRLKRSEPNSVLIGLLIGYRRDISRPDSYVTVMKLAHVSVICDSGQRDVWIINLIVYSER